MHVATYNETSVKSRGVRAKFATKIELQGRGSNVVLEVRRMGGTEAAVPFADLLRSRHGSPSVQVDAIRFAILHGAGPARGFEKGPTTVRRPG